MTKKHFIELANLIKRQGDFTPAQVEALAGFCQAQNSQFNKDRWLGYLKGTNGPNGGTT